MHNASEDHTVKVFAPGAYSYNNKGDATLVFAFLAWLEAAFRDVEVTLTSFEPRADSGHYGVPVLDMAVRPLRPIKNVGHRIGGMLWVRQIVPYVAYAYITLVCGMLALWVRFYRRAPHLAGIVAPEHVLTLAKAIESADLVVTVPGGFLLAPSRLNHWWLFHLPTLTLARVLGKKIILSPCSVGPFEGFYHKVARRILQRCALIYVREAWSEQYVLKLGVDRKRVVYCPDLAFLFRARNVSTAERVPASSASEVAASWAADVSRPLLGVSVREHDFPGTANPGECRRRYFTTVAETADYMVEHYNARVVVVPQTLEDRSAGRLVSTEMTRQNDVVVLEDDLSPSQLQELYAQCRMVVGTRMHANILAMCVNTPVMAIGYQPKTEGIMTALGLQEWVVPIDDLGDLLERTCQVWLSSEDLRKILPDRIDALRTQAYEAAKQLSGILKEDEARHDL